MAIEDMTTDKWWSNSSFSAATEDFISAIGTTTWMLVLKARLTSGNSYAVFAEATDSLGDTGTSWTIAFDYVTPLPTVTIIYPVNNTTYGTNWGGAIKSTGSSNAGSGTSITAASAAIENITTTKW